MKYRNLGHLKVSQIGGHHELRHGDQRGAQLAVLDAAPRRWERGETTDQLRTTPAEFSAGQRSTTDTSEKWFRLDEHRRPIRGSRGREFKSRQPDHI
jgi:hypothetical protein